MASEYELFVEASVRGYHAYFKNVTVYIGEVLSCESEPDNNYDSFAIAVKNNDKKTVGHVPIELAKIFHDFLSDYGEVQAECIGSRYNEGQGKGLELPVDYRLSGNYTYLVNVLKKLQQKEDKRSSWKLTDVKKCV